MELAPSTMFSATWCTIFVGPFLQESHWPNSTSLNHPRNFLHVQQRFTDSPKYLLRWYRQQREGNQKSCSSSFACSFLDFPSRNTEPSTRTCFMGPGTKKNHPITLGIFQKSAHQNGHVTSIRQNLRLPCHAAKVHSDVTSKAAPKRSKFTICSLDHTTPMLEILRKKTYPGKLKQGPTGYGPRKKLSISHSSIATYWTGSVGIWSHSIVLLKRKVFPNMVKVMV